MKRYILLAICMFFVPAVMATNGHAEGNGSGALDCGENRDVYLFDFWEGFSVYGRSIPETKWVGVDEQAFRAVDQLKLKNPELYSIARSVLERIFVTRDIVVTIPADASLPAPLDLKNKYEKRGCKIVGAALYNDETEIIDLDPAVVYRMVPTHQAGVYTHEAVYKGLRKLYGHTDSTKARDLTACLFAEDNKKCLAEDYR